MSLKRYETGGKHLNLKRLIAKITALTKKILYDL